ncbi:MAG: DUF3365 domain-containing protein [Pseudomonadota bacterium]
MRSFARPSLLAALMALAACGPATRAPAPGEPPAPVLAGPVAPMVPPAPATPDVSAFEAEARLLVPSFAGELLATVQQAMTAGGPVAAMAACQVAAPAIASRHSRQPWRVGRTALRVRNPANAPDAWEREVLARFVVAAAQGAPLSELRLGEVVAGEYRYMQAIATGEPCLACHGQTLAAPVQAALRQQYPGDAATGFALGDLRGAFTLRRRLE